MEKQAAPEMPVKGEGEQAMTEQETRGKICEIIAPYVSAWGDDTTIANALIGAGIGDVSEYKYRAEVAERALENEIKNRINITGDVENLVYAYYGRAIYQAEKELAEERKDVE